MTSIGFILFVFGFAVIQISESDLLDAILAVPTFSGLLMMVAGVAIKLWEVMP